MLDPNTPLADGVYLTWQGRTYPGGVESRETALLLSTEPEEGFEPRHPGRGYEREVPLTEVRIWQLTTVATWRDRTFQVLDRTPDQLLLGYLGHDQGEAESLGLTQQEPGVFTTTVPADEVTGIRQERSPA